MSETRVTSASFEVHPSVVFKLGSDLITDDIQAIAELIKNSYDADAKTVILNIETAESHPEAPADAGYVEIIDTGLGMTVEQLERGWLTISSSPKRSFKAEGRVTDRFKRTPLGDKGLGRLGSQRLGNRVTIVTTPKSERNTHRLTFEWGAFKAYNLLSEMTVTIESGPATRKQGTQIVISGLHNPEQFTADRLVEELAKMISPYEGVEDFRLAVSLDGQTLELGAHAAGVRQGSVVRYMLDFDGEDLRVRGLFRLGLFTPNAKKERPEFVRTISADKGAALMRHLKAQSGSEDWNLKRSTEHGWWGEVSIPISINSLGDREFEPSDDAADDDRDATEPDGSPATRLVATPGPFRGEIDAFNLSAGSIDEVGAFDSVKQARENLKTFSGIRVYRDGFSVRVDDDWLALGKQWSSGGSYFGLRPATTMGYLAISARNNAQLLETTDREGFQHTPHFNNLMRLMEQFVGQAAAIQEFLGREGARFRKASLADAEGDPERDPSDVADDLAAVLGRAQQWTGSFAEIRASLEQRSAEAERLVATYSARTDLSDDELELLASLNALSRHAARAGDLVQELSVFVDEVAEQRSGAARLQLELEQMSDQLELTYDTIAVGLTAEALSHEIANIATRLARRASTVNRHIRQRHPNDRQLGRFVDEVSGSVAGLRRQLAHLAPSLRFVRERREVLALTALCDDVNEYFADRWSERQMRIEIQPLEDFAVLMNRGKLIQVLDNLLLNSEYWLEGDLREGLMPEGVIVIEIDQPFVRVSDNGRGVDPGVSHSLFDAFVSRKPRGSGRGLGLYIVRRLLDAEGCTIALLPGRNAHERPFEFEIDLSGAIAE